MLFNFVLTVLLCVCVWGGVNVGSTGYYSIVTNYFQVHYEPVFSRSSWGRAVLPLFPTPGLLVVASLQPQPFVFPVPQYHQLQAAPSQAKIQRCIFSLRT